jgi:hypothetical protein
LNIHQDEIGPLQHRFRSPVRVALDVRILSARCRGV